MGVRHELFSSLGPSRILLLALGEAVQTRFPGKEQGEGEKAKKGERKAGKIEESSAYRCWS